MATKNQQLAAELRLIASAIENLDERLGEVDVKIVGYDYMNSMTLERFNAFRQLFGGDYKQTMTDLSTSTCFSGKKRFRGDKGKSSIEITAHFDNDAEFAVERVTAFEVKAKERAMNTKAPNGLTPKKMEQRF